MEEKRWEKEKTVQVQFWRDFQSQKQKRENNIQPKTEYTKNQQSIILLHQIIPMSSSYSYSQTFSKMKTASYNLCPVFFYYSCILEHILYLHISSDISSFILLFFCIRDKVITYLPRAHFLSIYSYIICTAC